MYNVIFESDNGLKYAFGKAGNTVFDMDFGNGVSVNLGTSQGVSQVGETVENQSVSGRPINIKGTVFGNVQERKKTMRKIFAPFVSGKLIFEGKYYTRVYVKNAPSFSPVKNDGRFTMQLFAPFPFFYAVDETSVFIGEIKALFRFPINYATPHRFGTRQSVKYKTIYNDGDVNIPFKLKIIANADSTNVTISNLKTFEFLKFNGTLSAGDTINAYRDESNVFHVELTSNGTVSDVIDMVDEGSMLFELKAGDNVIGVDSDEGSDNLTVTIFFNSAVVALYED